jgi:hypothetical protein
LSLPLLAARVFGLEILLAPVLAPFFSVLIFLQWSAQLPIFFAVPSLILLPPFLLQSSLQIEFLCGVDSCWDRPSALTRINHRLLLGSIIDSCSTVGSCWDRPSALAGIDRWL